MMNDTGNDDDEFSTVDKLFDEMHCVEQGSRVGYQIRREISVHTTVYAILQL